VTLKETLNSEPVGATFYFRDQPVPDYAKSKEPLSFCQAVEKVRQTHSSLKLTRDTLSCPAARYVLGFEPVDALDECLNNLVSSNRFNDHEAAYEALTGVPRITENTSSVTVSTRPCHPDVYILYLKPIQLMRVIQAYQKLHTAPIRLEIPGVVPVCGGCAATPYVSNRVTVSLGCDDSRRYGGIDEEQLVVGVPHSKADPLARTLR
jgi:uncharacterized protein (DUF169 family)